VFDYQNIHVVYTKEAQTADAYIERTTHVIANSENADVTVVSSDGLVQMIVVGEGARRISSREFQGEVKRVNEEGLKGVK
jgi:predicted RNA-binding protein with PIN domain